MASFNANLGPPWGGAVQEAAQGGVDLAPAPNRREGQVAAVPSRALAVEEQAPSQVAVEEQAPSRVAVDRPPTTGEAGQGVHRPRQPLTTACQAGIAHEPGARQLQ
ncbi:hypothetical protein DSECCO2_522210 [anaerobic digester metagenome]